MNIIALIFLAFAMSTDAFAAAIGKGVKLRKPPVSLALKLGLTFGITEAITPLIGWLIGQTAAEYVQAWDHWVALVLLAGLGIFMIRESLSSDDEVTEENAPTLSFGATLLTAVGTSIDAMAIGVGLAFMDVNIVLAAGLIGCATFMMVTLGVMLGGVLGNIVGKRAETLGGIILIGVGVWIFVSHVMG